MSKKNIIMIGDALKGIETELKHYGIDCTELINCCNPLSMIGNRDEALLAMSGQTNNMPTHLDIKKNLVQMLSKDPKNFVQNYNTMPYAKNVEYFNIAEYIIISNSGLAYEIYSNGEYVYSTHSKNAFTDHIKNDKSYKKVSFPFDNDFNWKSYYDEFIDAILREYDSKHIILIKTCCSPYYMDGTEINEFDPSYSECRDFFREADDYFASKTNCITIDNAYNNVPAGFNSGSILPYAEFSAECVNSISHVIKDIILSDRLPEANGCSLDTAYIVSLYHEFISSSDKSRFSDIVKEIVENGSVLPIVSAKKFRQKNIEFLSEYRYISNSLRNFPIGEKVYVKLSHNVFIVLNQTSNEPISKTVIPIQNKIDYKTVIGNGYACSIEQADSLCKDLAFYIERARHGCGNKPIRLVFDFPEDFYESLNYIDYPDLLENEYFLIGLKNDDFDIENYRARCDLSFFFDPKVKICVLDNGFSEQITRYTFSKRLEDYTGSTIYYDDLSYYLDYVMNGREIDKIIKDDINARAFSNIFSRKLLSNFKLGDVVPDILSENGLHEIIAVTNNNEELGNAVKKCNKLCLRSIEHDFMDKIFKCGFYPMYFNYRIRPEWLMNMRPFELRDYYEFPKMTGKNKELEDEMLGCDAVAIHIRRGDFVSLGWETDTSFYVEAIKNLIAIPDYPNKKYFIFSDDMPWVKKHINELGFGLLGNSKIVYIDHNKADNSYLDMYLISLAKVVISSGSAFARTAALFGTRCEDFIFGVKKAVEMFEMIGRKNKHNISFSNDYRPDYSNVSWLRNETQHNNKLQ